MKLKTGIALLCTAAWLGAAQAGDLKIRAMPAFSFISPVLLLF